MLQCSLQPCRSLTIRERIGKRFGQVLLVLIKLAEAGFFKNLLSLLNKDHRYMDTSIPDKK